MADKKESKKEEKVAKKAPQWLIDKLIEIKKLTSSVKYSFK